MEIKVKAKHIKISPRKLRLVVDVVRKMSAEDALNQLKFINKKGALPVAKLIKSGIATAVNDFELDKNNLFVKEIRVDEGATMKRWMPRARGRATPIRKRTSHIVLVLGELIDSGIKKAKKKEIDAPVKLSDLGGGEKKTEKDAKQTKKEDLGEEKKVKTEKKAEAKKEAKNEKGFVKKVFRRKNG